MLKWFLNALKIFVIVGIVIAALSVLGKYVNTLINWSYLTIFFSIIKHGLDALKFIWDMDTLWICLGISLNLGVAYSALRATLWGIRWYQGIN